MIKFGISKDYVPHWGVVQAIREIYQNFIDYGEYDVEVIEINDTVSSVRLSNDFKPESWEFLKIGFSRKKDGAIGKHGEGLKLAGLIFNRNNKVFQISSCLGQAEAEFYDDENIGSCYGLSINETTSERFEVYFEADSKDLSMFIEGHVKKNDILQSSYCGDIVKKEAGNIYVGKLFVCKLPGLKYALNFNPDCVDLGRDRDMPSTFDLEYYTNQIINSCSHKLEFKPSDINNREFNVGSLPSELTKQFRPIMSDEGDIQMKAGKTIITDKDQINQIAANPEVAKKVEKLKYAVIYKQKKTPSTVLTEFKNSLNLNSNERLRFDSIIKLARGWKVK